MAAAMLDMMIFRLTHMLQMLMWQYRYVYVMTYVMMMYTTTARHHELGMMSTDSTRIHDPCRYTNISSIIYRICLLCFVTDRRPAAAVRSFGRWCLFSIMHATDDDMGCYYIAHHIISRMHKYTTYMVPAAHHKDRAIYITRMYYDPAQTRVHQCTTCCNLRQDILPPLAPRKY